MCAYIFKVFCFLIVFNIYSILIYIYILTVQSRYLVYVDHISTKHSLLHYRNANVSITTEWTSYNNSLHHQQSSVEYFTKDIPFKYSNILRIDQAAFIVAPKTKLLSLPPKHHSICRLVQCWPSTWICNCGQ